MNEMNYVLLTITLNEELFKRTQTAAISAHIKEKNIEVDWPCPEKGNFRNTLRALRWDSTWEKK